MFVIKKGKCKGGCPGVWEVTEEEAKEYYNSFETQKEAEQFIKREYGRFPVECQ